LNTTTWNELISALSAESIDVCVQAASRIHAEASADDIPNLLKLLKSDDSFIREAAAWPLAELAGATVLVELFTAYQRGFDEGHDNDGFTAALLEIPALFPNEAKALLENMANSTDEPMRGHAKWLLEFI
jgi:HEAT repeat protein